MSIIEPWPAPAIFDPRHPPARRRRSTLTSLLPSPKHAGLHACKDRTKWHTSTRFPMAIFPSETLPSD
jgi:hypothetical protein